MKCPFCNHCTTRWWIPGRARKATPFAAAGNAWPANAASPPTSVSTKCLTWSSRRTGGARSSTARRSSTASLKACEKRPVSMVKLSDLVNRVESKVSDSPDREISTTDIGEFLIENLQELDKIAYVRFASVYRDFQDEEAFFNELKSLDAQQVTLNSAGLHRTIHHRRVPNLLVT